MLLLLFLLMRINLDAHRSANITNQRLLFTQFIHSPAAVELFDSLSCPERDLLGRGLSTGALSWSGSPLPGTLLTTSPSLSLSLLHSGSTTSQGMFQHATSSQPGVGAEGEEQRIREGGNPGKNPPWLSLLHLVSTHSFYFEHFNTWWSYCL